MAQTLSFLAVLAWSMLVYSDGVGAVLSKIISTEGETVHQLEWRKDFVLSAAFLGTAVAAGLGFANESAISWVIAAMWFYCGLWYSRSITTKLNELETQEQSIRWRKTAGMIRSIVKSEVARHKED